jgi:hypothetical protein
MRMADSFVMYRSYIEAARKLPVDKQLSFYNWLIDFALDDIEPDFSAESPEMRFALDLAFGQIKESVSASIKRYKSSVENGKKGGNPNFKKGQPNPYYKKKDFSTVNSDNITQDNLNYNDNVNGNYNSLSVSEVGGLTAPPPPRKRNELTPEQIAMGWKPVVE